VQLENLINLEKLLFRGYFEGKKDIDSLKKILNLPKITNLSIFLGEVDVTFQKEKWSIEVEGKEKVTVNSKEELLKLIETFELTLVD
jgi:hypothetical protein